MRDVDELDLIERFRSDVPDEHPTARAAAWAALSEAIDPARAGRNRARTRIRLGWAAAGALATALVVAIAVPAVLPGDREPSAAADTLRRAAAVAAAQPYEPVESGQFVYTRTEAMWQSTICEGTPSGVASDAPPECTTDFVNVDREAWIGPDGSGRLRQTEGDGMWDETFGHGELWFEDVSTLPTDVEALRSVVEERASQSDNPLDYEMFVVIGDLLRETNPSPEVRAALFELAATIDGVELIGDTTDHSGRPGVAVATTFMGIRHELIFDPETSAILGERAVQVDPPVTDASPAPGVGVNADGVDDPGTVVGWTVVVASGVVDSTDQRP